MKTQAWRWLAAGVLAAGLNASYHDGGLQWAHQVVDRIEQGKASVLALALGQADMFLTEARLLTTPNGSASCPLSRAMAQVQAAITPSRPERDRFEAMSAREEAQLVRLEANRARIEAQVVRVRVPAVAFNSMAFQSFKAPVVCPRVRVNIPRLRINMPAIPVVHVEMPGSGPV